MNSTIKYHKMKDVPVLSSCDKETAKPVSTFVNMDKVEQIDCELDGTATLHLISGRRVNISSVPLSRDLPAHIWQFVILS